MSKFKYNLIQIYFEIYEWWRTFIRKEQDCDNCKYYGRVMCDHVDADCNCLGWERKSFNLLDQWKYRRLIRRLSRLESKMYK